MSKQGQYADRAGRYRLDSLIATGGMGVVWRGTDTRLNRPVAVKVLRAEYSDDPTFRTRFEGEARSAAALHHAGIASVYDYGGGDTDARPPYLVMELVDGQPLSAVLASARSDGRVIDTAVVQDLIAQAGDALGVAHRAGIVHRDVKPANLLVTADRKVKITDFGIARTAHSAALTRTGSVMGTPQYLSPEQAQGIPSIPASDVYSLGVVAYECLTGRRPFEAETPVATALAHLQRPVPTLPASVPAPLAAVVRRALAKDPAERFADGTAFAVAVRNPSSAVGASGSTAPATPADTSEATADDGPSDKHSPWVAMLGVAILLGAAITVATFVVGDGDGDDIPGSAGSAPSEAAQDASADESSEDAAVTIDAGDYVCRDDVDYREAANDLRSLGLQVSVEPTQTANEGSCPEDAVASISPMASLHEGDRVVLRYWGPIETTGAATPTVPSYDSASPPSDEDTAPADGDDPTEPSPSEESPESGDTSPPPPDSPPGPPQPTPSPE